MHRVNLTWEAELDVEDAKSWYERQQPGLGKRFVREVDAVMAAIAERPHYFPFIYRDMRRAMLKHFPYAVFYVEQGDMLDVQAVMDLRRHPKSWQSRR